MFASAKGKQQKKLRQLFYSVRSHITFRDCRMHIFLRQSFSKYLYSNSNKPRALIGSKPCFPAMIFKSIKDKGLFRNFNQI